MSTRFWLALSIIAFAILRTISARAAEHVAEHVAEQPAAAHAPAKACATLISFTGDVRVLDPGRTSIIDTAPHAAVPCGGWVSTVDGSAELRHRDGYRVRLGPQTFVEIPEANADGQNSGDHITLYKGEVFAEAGNGTRELRVVTANARVRVIRGRMLVVFASADEQTQAIALDNPITVENRFEGTRRVRVRGGESSALNFRLARIVPSAPRAVSTAALKQRLSPVALEEVEQKAILARFRARETRGMPASLTDSDESTTVAAAEPVVTVARAPASAAPAMPKSHSHGLAVSRKPAAAHPTSYTRHKARKEDAMLRAHMVERLSGGDPDAARALKQENAEKKKLLERLGELSHSGESSE